MQMGVTGLGVAGGMGVGVSNMSGVNMSGMGAANPYFGQMGYQAGYSSPSPTTPTIPRQKTEKKKLAIRVPKSAQKSETKEEEPTGDSGKEAKTEEAATSQEEASQTEGSAETPTAPKETAETKNVETLDKNGADEGTKGDLGSANSPETRQSDSTAPGASGSEPEPTSSKTSESGSSVITKPNVPVSSEAAFEAASFESISSEPAPSEPALDKAPSSEPAFEAASFESTPSEPGPSEPALDKAPSSEPVSSETDSTEITPEPASSEPLSSEPASSKSVSSESASSEVTSTEPASSEPVASDDTTPSDDLVDKPVDEPVGEATSLDENAEKLGDLEEGEIDESSFSFDYPKGIWSPQNQDGSKRYPLKLLLAFQPHFVSPPEGLSPQSIADIKANNLGFQGGHMGGRGNFRSGPSNSPGRPPIAAMPMRGGMASGRRFIGGPPRGSPQGHQQGHPQMQNSGAFMGGHPRGGQMYPGMAPPHSGPQSQQWVSRAEPVAPLKKGDNAWSRPKKSDGTEEERRALLLMKVNGLLNKITEETFTILSDQILALGIDSADTMEGVISLLYEKALLEPGYSSMYADLCAKLSKLKIFKDGKERTFRVILLARCQEKFEGTLRERVPDERSEEDKDLTEEEWEDKIYLIRHKILGNITFICELYKKKMLASSVIAFCIQSLTDDAKNNKIPESMECLCKLLVNIGKIFDKGKPSPLDFVFQTMEALSRDKTVDSRLRFKFDDVINLRKRAWKVIKKDDIGRKEGEPDRRGPPMKRPSQNQGGRPNARESSHSKGSKTGWQNRQQSGQNQQQQEGWRSVGGSQKKAAPSQKAKTAAPQPMVAALMPEPATPEPAAPEPANLDPFRHETDTKIEKEVNLMIEEFMTSRDHEEAALCVKDLKDPGCYYVVVLRSVLLSTEKKEKERATIAEMLDGLNKSNALETSHFVTGFERCLQFIPDIAIDVPFAPRVYGQLFARGVVSGWIDSFSHLFKWTKGLDDPRLLENIVGSALEVGLEASGLDELCSSLKEGGIEKFQDIFTDKEVSDMDRFVGKFGLDALKQAMQ